MNRTEKSVIIDRLKEDLALHGGSLVLVQFQGMTVERANAVRKEFRQAECVYEVVKNTLLRAAVNGTPMEGVAPLCKGSTAIAYSKTDPVAPARTALKCAKEHEHFVVKGGFFEQFLDARSVEQLSNMPSLDQMRSRLLATFIAAPQQFMRLLLAAPQRFMMVLEARKRELEK